MALDFDFSSPLYKAHSQRSSKPKPAGAGTPVNAPAAGGFDMAAALAAFAQMAGASDDAALRSEREASGGIRRGMDGQPIDPNMSTSPWSGPITFPSIAERQAQLDSYLRPGAPVGPMPVVPGSPEDVTAQVAANPNAAATFQTPGGGQVGRGSPLEPNWPVLDRMDKQYMQEVALPAQRTKDAAQKKRFSFGGFR